MRWLGTLDPIADQAEGLRAYSEVRVSVQRVLTGLFPALIITSLAAAAHAGQIPPWFLLIAAFILLHQASVFRPADLLPGYSLPRQWRRAAADIELAEMRSWTASVRNADLAGKPDEETRTGRVKRQCTAELDAYQASLPGYSDWGPA